MNFGNTDSPILNEMGFITCGFFSLYIKCYLGAFVTANYSKLSDVLYQSKFYDLPIALQKIYIPMIANTQYLLVYDGLYSVPLNLTTFTKVCFVHKYVR